MASAPYYQSFHCDKVLSQPCRLLGFNFLLIAVSRTYCEALDFAFGRDVDNSPVAANKGDNVNGEQLLNSLHPLCCAVPSTNHWVFSAERVFCVEHFPAYVVQRDKLFLRQKTVSSAWKVLYAIGSGCIGFQCDWIEFWIDLFQVTQHSPCVPVCCEFLIGNGVHLFVCDEGSKCNQFQNFPKLKKDHLSIKCWISR